MKTRTWFRVHSFTGVITGLLLFVICWSGTFAVLSYEIDLLVLPGARVAPAPVQAGWGEWMDAVNRAYPGAQVSFLQPPLYPGSTAQAVVNLPEQGFAGVYIDPYRAEVVGQHSLFNVQRFFRDFHRRLFFPKPWGGYLVDVFALTLLVSLVAALLFYKRWWRRGLRFRCGGGWVFWSELHKLTGLWSLWFVLVIALTGAWYLFEEGRSHLGDGKVIYAGQGRAAVQQVPALGSDPALPRLPLDRLMAQVQSHWPTLEVTIVGYDFPVEDAFYAAGRAGFALARDRANQIVLDASTGEVLSRHAWDELPPYWLWSNMADPLHFGDFGGLWSKLIWFVFGLALSGLILTGTWLHAQRLAREAGGRIRHRWPGTGAALAVSLLVLAASVPAGFQRAVGFGPTVDGVRQLPDLAPGVQAVILGWTGLTLVILAVWVWLLWRTPARSGWLEKC